MHHAKSYASCNLLHFCHEKSHQVSTRLLCLQRQLVLLSLFDANCAQIINTSAGELLTHLTHLLAV